MTGNAELIKRARYFHADDLGGLVLPLVTALEAAEADIDAAAESRQEWGIRATTAEAERDEARALIEQLAALVKDSPHEWSTRLGESIVILLVAERDFDAILNARATS